MSWTSASKCFVLIRNTNYYGKVNDVNGDDDSVIMMITVVIIIMIGGKNNNINRGN